MEKEGAGEITEKGAEAKRDLVNFNLQ